MLLPLKAWWNTIDESRGAFAVYSYVRLNNNTTPASFEAENLKGWYNGHGYVNENSG
jgi:hypothetical protein